MNASIETGPVRPSRGRRLLPFAIAAAVLLAAGGFALWWVNRPIQPVTLSPAEKQRVEEKVAAVREEPDRGYVPGSREIIFTERELNGLLHAQTQLGERLRFEFAKDAIHARIDTELDEDLPLLGGRRLKGRARFLVSQDEAGARLVLDDVTLWGVSLPNDWLGGIKGRDLIGEVFGGGLAGVESFAIDSGQVLIALKE